MRIALFAGSFDPITLGHVDIIDRAAQMFDKVIVGLGENTSKNYLFPFELRHEMVAKTFEGHTTIEVLSFRGLTVEVCRKTGARYMVRGLRSGTDYDYERHIAEMNRQLYPEAESLFLISRPQFADITATIVREIYRNGGDVDKFVPKAVIPYLNDFNKS
ncbi:MAG: pantetheine-phosphate adenylyltransferase [Bacteroidota bacterium]|nr:pantetheine-phosphate adenylyltransferase [Bacteroidota bacterium]